MKKSILLFIGCYLTLIVYSQSNPLWLRYPAISPDGKTIVFSYKGDLYKVSAAGGNASPLTMHEAHDYMPVWSHDGKYIAFASDRFGNFDVFVMPAEGGEPTRLTYNSTNDYPWDFTADNKQISVALYAFPIKRFFRNYTRYLYRGVEVFFYQPPVQKMCMSTVREPSLFFRIERALRTHGASITLLL